MQKIEGFVCDAIYNYKVDQRVLFGPGNGVTDNYYAALEINGLSVFENIEQAKKVEPLLKASRDLSYFNIGPARLKMEVAETSEETYKFMGKTGLIVLGYGEKLGNVRLIDLIGTREGLADGHPTGMAHKPGAQLRYNGMKPFPDFERAFYAMSEFSRQSGMSPARMALFELRRLDETQNLQFDFSS